MKTAQHELRSVRQKPQKPALILIDVNTDCESIVVHAPVKEVYERCLNFEALPRFVTSITKMEKVNDMRFWCTSIVNGKEVKSDVQIMMRVPDRRIAWQAVSDHFRIGVVFLDPIAGDATKVTVKVRSIVEPVLLTGALRDCLRNFKRFVEDDIAEK